MECAARWVCFFDRHAWVNNFHSIIWRRHYLSCWFVDFYVLIFIWLYIYSYIHGLIQTFSYHNIMYYFLLFVHPFLPIEGSKLESVSVHDFPSMLFHWYNNDNINTDKKRKKENNITITIILWFLFLQFSFSSFSLSINFPSFPSSNFPLLPYYLSSGKLLITSKVPSSHSPFPSPLSMPTHARTPAPTHTRTLVLNPLSAQRWERKRRIAQP